MKIDDFFADKGSDSEPSVRSLQFGALEAVSPSSAGSGSIDILKDVPMVVTAELGRTNMLVKDILKLGMGSVIELEKMTGEPVDILVNGKLIAKGEVVAIDENFGIKVTEICNR